MVEEWIRVSCGELDRKCAHPNTDRQTVVIKENNDPLARLHECTRATLPNPLHLPPPFADTWCYTQMHM